MFTLCIKVIDYSHIETNTEKTESKPVCVSKPS